MFESRLPRIAAKLAVEADAIARAGAEMVSVRAKARVPVRTGSLRDAIHIDHVGPGEYEVVAGNSNVFYGHIVEHGGVRSPAHPFLTPAEESRGEIVSIGIAALRNL
jgi:HK97 gp10 family phage protein